METIARPPLCGGRKYSILLLVLLISLPGLRGQTAVRPFPAQVGDIGFDAAVDDTAFHRCDTGFAFQYYYTDSWYRAHKQEVRQYFMEHYRPPSGKQGPEQTGWLTIRFLINCRGETGRFRLLEVDSAYRAFHFSPALSRQLLDLTRHFSGWQPAGYRDKTFDTYQYITFKLKKGVIECLLP